MPESSLARLREQCEVTYLFPADDRAGASSAVTAAEGLLVNSHTMLDGDLLRRALNLRAVSTVSVGLDHIDLDIARERGIAVTTTPVLTDAVADLVMALMVMLARRLPEAAPGGELGEVQRGTARQRHGRQGPPARRVRPRRPGGGRGGAWLSSCASATGTAGTTCRASTGVERELDLEKGNSAEAKLGSLHVDLDAGHLHLIGAKEWA